MYACQARAQRRQPCGHHGSAAADCDDALQQAVMMQRSTVCILAPTRAVFGCVPRHSRVRRAGAESAYPHMCTEHTCLQALPANAVAHTGTHNTCSSLASHSSASLLHRPPDQSIVKGTPSRLCARACNMRGGLSEWSIRVLPAAAHLPSRPRLPACCTKRLKVGVRQGAASMHMPIL